LRLSPALGGRSIISAGDYLEGPPELVVEVATSSVSQDMNRKKRVYARNGVPEYIVFQVYERQVAWFVLREDGYQQLAPGEDGVLRSEIFPGLWLDPAAFWTGDMMKVLTVAQQGIASPEHQAYIERLNERAKSR
jgi:Uma2 family endonuclease